MHASVRNTEWILAYFRLYWEAENISGIPESKISIAVDG